MGGQGRHGALVLDPRFVPALINLADLFRAQGRDADGERALAHALGLLRVRQGRHGEAVALLQQAVQGRPESTRFAYVYAVALHGTGNPSRALTVLEEAHRQRPADRDVLSALVTSLREGGDSQAALGYAEQLLTLTPGDREVQRLVEALRRQAGSQ